MGCVAKQFLNKNWILSNHSVPGFCLHMIFARQSISTPKWLSQKPEKSTCEWWPWEIWSFEVGQKFKFLWFQAMISRQQQAYKGQNLLFFYNSTHIFRKWKKTYFNNVLDTYICFQSSNFIQWVTFCSKRAKIRPPVSWEWVGILGKNLAGAKCHHLVQNNWKQRESEDIIPWLCPYFSENGS